MWQRQMSDGFTVQAIDPTIVRPEYAYKAFDELHLADALRSRNVTWFLKIK